MDVRTTFKYLKGCHHKDGRGLIYVTIRMEQNTHWKPQGDIFRLYIKKNSLANKTIQKTNRQQSAVWH